MEPAAGVDDAARIARELRARRAALEERAAARAARDAARRQTIGLTALRSVIGNAQLPEGVAADAG
jgi:hypothetical protein